MVVLNDQREDNDPWNLGISRVLRSELEKSVTDLARSSSSQAAGQVSNSVFLVTCIFYPLSTKSKLCLRLGGSSKLKSD